VTQVFCRPYALPALQTTVSKDWKELRSPTLTTDKSQLSNMNPGDALRHA